MPTILITGCARGIGNHMVNVFAAKGFQVMATDVDFGALEACLPSWNPDLVSIHPLNVADYGQWQAVIKACTTRWGKIDYLLNNAGVLPATEVWKVTQQEIDRTIDINSKGVMYGTSLMSEHMVANGAGHIINIASIAGITASPGLSVYCGSKFAVRGFSVSAAYELRPKGVHLSVICPDAIDTPMTKEHEKNQAAGMIFSTRFLTVQHVERAILKAVRTRRLEILFPRSRGAIARIASMFPSLGFSLSAPFMRKGLKRQGRVSGR